MRHIQEKHDAQKKVADLEQALGELNGRYECVQRERLALKELNLGLDKRVRDLQMENSMFLT